MVFAKVRRLLTFSVSLMILQLCESYEIPDLRIQALVKGFRASIPDAPGLALFVFQGNINSPIANTTVGSLSGEVLQPTNGRWVFEDPKVQLKVGDSISYYAFASVNSTGYIHDTRSFTVKALEDPAAEVTTPGPADCQPTATTVRGGRACAGQTIFEDHFNTFREDVWQIEQYIPVNHPEYPFVSYQRLSADPTVSVAGGNLRIVPRLQQNQPGFNNESMYSGSLNLFSGCTGSANECSFQAWGASILPPVVSGRVTNRGLAFKYGTVTVRAKLPQGDWLYPEILLEPFLNKYGNSNYASGVLKIAAARGNKRLNYGVTEYGNKILYGGPVMDFKCQKHLLYDHKLSNGRMWGDDFHEYSIKWTPDSITLLVDLVEWATFTPGKGGLIAFFPPGVCPNLPRDFLASGTTLAPFDDHFYITLGLATGGITEFPDDIFSDGVPKPWRNQGRKASLNFWTAMDSWYPSWTNSELLVDYIKVVAL